MEASNSVWRRTCAGGLVGVVIMAMVVGVGCTPRVEVAPSDKPITINLNVKIDHEIRVKVDKDLEQVMSRESGLF